MLMILRQRRLGDRPDYFTTVLYLNLLVATCQLVHSVNLDRMKR